MKKSLENHLAVVQFIPFIQSHLPKEVTDALNANQLGLDPFDLYLAAEVSGLSGEQTIMDVQTDKLVGRCSFDSNGRLNGKKTAFFSKAVVLCGAAAAAGDDPETVAYKAVMNDSLRNVEIVMYQRNQEVFRSPLEALNGKVGSSSNLDVYREFDSPRFLVPGEDITIKIETPRGVQIAANTYIKLVIPALITRTI